MAGLFGWFGGESKTNMPPVPESVPSVIVDPMSRVEAADLMEKELAKMSCTPSDQMKRVIEVLKTPSYVLTGGKRRRHPKTTTRKSKKAARKTRGRRR
jgi:hypothetical protein